MTKEYSLFPPLEDAFLRGKVEGTLATLTTAVVGEVFFPDNKKLKWGLVLATSLGSVIMDTCWRQHVETRRRLASTELEH